MAIKLPLLQEAALLEMVILHREVMAPLHRRV
jgi:hypothetical protein